MLFRGVGEGETRFPFSDSNAMPANRAGKARLSLAAAVEYRFRAKIHRELVHLDQCKAEVHSGVYLRAVVRSYLYFLELHHSSFESYIVDRSISTILTSPKHFPYLLSVMISAIHRVCQVRWSRLSDYYVVFACPILIFPPQSQ